MALPRSQGGLIILLVLFTYPLWFIAAARMLPNFLLPTYGILHLFSGPATTASDLSPMNWTTSPELFGLAVPSVVLSLGLQWIIGAFGLADAGAKNRASISAPVVAVGSRGVVHPPPGDATCPVVGCVAGEVSGPRRGERQR